MRFGAGQQKHAVFFSCLLFLLLLSLRHHMATSASVSHRKRLSQAQHNRTCIFVDLFCSFVHAVFQHRRYNFSDPLHLPSYPLSPSLIWQILLQDTELSPKHIRVKLHTLIPTLVAKMFYSVDMSSASVIRLTCRHVQSNSTFSAQLKNSS